MDFSEAERRRTFLSGQLTSGQITHETFTASINTLRVTDAAGRSWQPMPARAGWLCWNGTAWQPATPPEFAKEGWTGPQPRSSAKDFSEFKSSLMTVDEFRKVSKDVPLAKRPQKWWDLLSILGGIAGAVLWFIYGGIRSGQEGFDLITPLLMIAIPVILVWFRADIDQLLLPLQPSRKKFSRILLIGFGIATPFLTAWLLYNIFHISQYPLMQWNIVLGTMVSYALVRDPVLAKGSRKPVPAIMTSAGIVFFIMFMSLLAVPVLADDCERDPLNAQDCLRTSGYAEVIAGTAAAGLGVLVNGPIIIQGIVAGGAGAAAGAAGASGAAGSGTGAGGEQKIYGTGRPGDPYRDGHTIGEIGPDGRFIPYPENADKPPQIYGTGTPDDPYTNIPPAVIDHTPTPPDMPPEPPAPPTQPVQPPEPPAPPTQPVQPPEPPAPPTQPVQPPEPPAPPTQPVQPSEPPKPPELTPAQKQQLIDAQKRITDAQEALKAKWQRRRWLENTGLPNAKKVRTAQWMRTAFKGGKDAVDAVTDPKGKLWDGTKKKLGIETPLDKAKDKVFGKEVEMKDVVREFKEADEKVKELQRELDSMPSEEKMLQEMRDLKAQLSKVQSRLQGGK